MLFMKVYLLNAIKAAPAVKLWDDTKILADKENKTPVITLCEKNRPGFGSWYILMILLKFQKN